MSPSGPAPSVGEVEPLPIEAFDVPGGGGQGRARGGWVARVLRTLLRVAVRPGHSLAWCPEPVMHGRVLRFLATLRFPIWLVVLAALGVRHLTEAPSPIESRGIHTILDPALADALSTWLLLMIPVGLPLLYFFGGLLAHIAIALTGGAPRSIGATMRATGYTLGPALLVIGLLDIPLYLNSVPAAQYFLGLQVVTLFAWISISLGLARTHRISVVRGFLVAILPALMLASVTALRALPEVTGPVPGLPQPSSPYYVP